MSEDRVTVRELRAAGLVMPPPLEDGDWVLRSELTWLAVALSLHKRFSLVSRPTLHFRRDGDIGIERIRVSLEV